MSMYTLQKMFFLVLELLARISTILNQPSKFVQHSPLEIESYSVQILELTSIFQRQHRVLHGLFISLCNFFKLSTWLPKFLCFLFLFS